ncbi:hypothetical protein C8P68_103268 [Mucilaginibacter yixingensis]|uniref:Uncharacterized protein n=1 Tax=Mucilaginibacter yixingensis TaxID=1295612 RepID=A0A2T5JB60_9SPHI|nr:hypothetical protein [Mucilaginibacter yixingensis]PTQ98108.1 hypothetical protein C8P68_103268 [Mucilaginibacter yixingensis]
MKKYLLLLPLLCGCAESRQVFNNSSALQSHQQPLKVFSIGYWNHSSRVLTLTDAAGVYFTIRDAKNDSLKIGDVYHY